MSWSGRLRDIEELAEFVAETYFPNDRIEPEAIAESNNISYNYGHYGDAFDGLLECQDESFHIFGNLDRVKSPGHARARFTFAHELGHFYIDDHRNALVGGVGPHGSFTDYQSSNPAEKEADAFSAALLMPERRFNSAAMKNPPGEKAIRKLVDIFGTSYSSTAIRYAKSNSYSVMVMRWTGDGRRWCWSSNDLYEATKNRVYKSVSRIPAGSLTALAMMGQVADEVSRGSTLSAWCASVTNGSRSDRIVVEEVLSLGEYGVLTLLYPD